MLRVLAALANPRRRNAPLSHHCASEAGLKAVRRQPFERVMIDPFIGLMDR